MEASLNRLLWNRSISPNSLLETSISEEVRPRDLEEEEATQALGPLLPPTTTSRRHTLAEVSARFHQCNPPCKLHRRILYNVTLHAVLHRSQVNPSSCVFRYRGEPFGRRLVRQLLEVLIQPGALLAGGHGGDVSPPGLGG